MEFLKLSRLKPQDKVAVLSPSFAAPGRWPEVYALGLTRLREVFGLRPVEFPSTRKVGATKSERSADLAKAFLDADIKAVIASLGGNDQVTYVKHLDPITFRENPKMFFGFSDNTHFHNFLWLHGVPSFYGASLFTQFAMQGRMDEFTVRWIKRAMFEQGEFQLEASAVYNDVGLQWDDPGNLETSRAYEPNDGWYWDGNRDSAGIAWGGCLESIDELLRHAVPIPSLKQFERIVLFTETSEEIPSADYVRRVFRALGERGILDRIQGVLVGRPKAWDFGRQTSAEEKSEYRASQRQTTLEIIRKYNPTVPVVQNMDFGHTDPQICVPSGGRIRFDSRGRRVFATY